MSNLQKSVAKAKLADMSMEPRLLSTMTIDEEPEAQGVLRPLPTATSAGEDDNSSASSTSSISSVGTIKPALRQSLSSKERVSDMSAYSPLPWNTSFSSRLSLSKVGSPFTYNVYYSPPVTAKAPLFILLHGAGCSGLSFAVCASQLKTLAPEIGLFAPDMRAHGETEFRAEYGESELVDGRMDMSLSKLAHDAETVIGLLMEHEGWGELPNLILIGHSLGGAVVTEVASRGKFASRVLGFAVIDVVEGSAVEALVSMNAYLAARPNRFASLEEGIEWHIKSRTIRGLDSARTSVPGYLKLVPPEQDRTSWYEWVTDLKYTSPYWNDWFGGMSKKFLEARGGKLLLLAGTDRLDKELMIGQMQGKYQLQVFPDAGHFVQEDQPEKTAQVLIDFWKRNDGSLLVLPPKVGTSGIGTAKNA